MLGVLTAIADYILRQRASDHVSVITDVLLGVEIAPELQQADEGQQADKEAHDAKHRGQRSPPFGIGADLFLRQVMPPFATGSGIAIESPPDRRLAAIWLPPSRHPMAIC